MSTADSISVVLSAALAVIVAIGTSLLTIGKYKERVDHLSKDFDKMEERLNGMRTGLDRMEEFKIEARKFIDSIIYKAQSPLSLNDYGKRLVADSGFDALFPEVRDDLVRRLAALDPTSQYDVQEKARALMDSLRDYPPFKKIEQYAFESGNDFGQILRAGAIRLRDYYFEQHPEVVNASERW